MSPADNDREVIETLRAALQVADEVEALDEADTDRARQWLDDQENSQ